MKSELLDNCYTMSEDLRFLHFLFLSFLLNMFLWFNSLCWLTDLVSIDPHAKPELTKTTETGTVFVML